MAKKINIANNNSNTFEILVDDKVIKVETNRKLRYPCIMGIQQATIGGDIETPFRPASLRSALWEKGIAIGKDMLLQINKKELVVVRNILKTADGDKTISLETKIPSSTETAVSLGLLPADVLENKPKRSASKSPKEKLGNRIAAKLARMERLHKEIETLQAEYESMPDDKAQETATEETPKAKAPAKKTKPATAKKTATTKRTTTRKTTAKAA